MAGGLAVLWTYGAEGQGDSVANVWEACVAEWVVLMFVMEPWGIEEIGQSTTKYS